MGPRVSFASNPFGAISPNKVVETKKTVQNIYIYIILFWSRALFGGPSQDPNIYRKLQILAKLFISNVSAWRPSSGTHWLQSNIV